MRRHAWRWGVARGRCRTMRRAEPTTCTPSFSSRSRSHVTWVRAQPVREHIERTGLPPSRSELAGSLGLAHASAVKHHLHALEKKGWLEVKPGVYRGIYLLYEGTPVFDPGALPTVPAGTPALADESAAVVRVPDDDALRELLALNLGNH